MRKDVSLLPTKLLYFRYESNSFCHIDGTDSFLYPFFVLPVVTANSFFNLPQSVLRVELTCCLVFLDYTEGAELVDAVLDVVRKEAEGTDALQGKLSTRRVFCD